MQNRQYLYLFIPLFFLLTLSNAFAYASVEYNKTITDGAWGTNPVHFRCTNSTAGTGVNCYHAWGVTPTLQQYNETLDKTGQCILTNYTSGSIPSMAVLNDTHILFVSSMNCDLWDVTNIGSSSCFMESRKTYCNLTDASVSSMAVSNGKIFQPKTRVIVNADDYTIDQNPAYWNNTWDDGDGSYYLTMISIPDRANDYTVFLSGRTGYGGDKPSSLIRYDGETRDAILEGMNTIYGTFGQSMSNTTDFDLIINNTGYVWGFIYSKYASVGGTSRVYRVDFSNPVNYTSACNWDGELIGTTCKDSSIYATNLDNCNVIYGSCPSGSLCTAFTPVINATNDIGLVENWTGCGFKSVTGANVRCFNICFNGAVIASNCPDVNCQSCPDMYGFITYGGKEGYYTKSWFTNQTTISASGHTIGCFNPITSTYDYIVNTTGNQTTEEGILEQAGNNVTNVSTIDNVCQNTTTTCYSPVNCLPIPCISGGDNSFYSLGHWINIRFKTDYATEVIAFVVSLGFGMFIFMKSHGKKAETFIVPFLGVLCGFCLPGVEFFPLWIWLLLTIFTGVLIFWKAKSG